MGFIGLLKLIIALFGFSILVFFHEFGHFIMGKFFKIKVEKFSIGMGPSLFGFTKWGTNFQVSAVPFGGYCKFKGDEITDDQNIVRDPDSFYGTAPSKRLLVVLFGPFMNYIIAIIFLAMLAMQSHHEVFLPNKIMIVDDLPSYKNESSPAKIGGLQSKDQIIKIDKKNMNSYDQIVRYLNIPPFFDFIKSEIHHKKNPYQITVIRNGKIIDLQVNPKWSPDSLRYIIGITYYLNPVIKNSKQSILNKELGLKDNDTITGIDSDYNNISAMKINDYLNINFSQNKKSILHVQRDNKNIDIPIAFNEINNKVSKKDFFITFDYQYHDIKAENLITAFSKAFNDSNDIIKGTAIGFYSLIFKPKKNVKDIFGGPLKVGKIIGDSTYEAFEEGPESGIRAFFSIVSLISLSLAFINLLPIPALDGGHILFNIIEIIRRKPISIKIMNVINMIFFFILITFMIVVVTFIDIPDLFK